MTGIIQFNDVESLSYDHQFKFWGQSRNYANTQTYTVRSRVTGNFTQDTISGVWTSSSGIINSLHSGLCQIYINDVSIGLGQVRSINFDASVDTREKPYTAIIEIPLLAGSGMFSGSGSINNTGVFFSDTVGENFITYFASPTGQYIKEFSYSKSSDQVASGRFTFEKNFSFSIDDEIQDAFGVTPASYAKRLIDAVRRSYSSEFLFNGSYPSFYPTPSGVSFTTQSFDTLNNNYSVSERFDYQEGLPYTWEYNHQLSFDGTAVSVEEKGKVVASRAGASIFDYALTGWNVVSTGISGRIRSVFDSYSGILYYNSGCPISAYPVRTSIIKDQCGASIEYSYSFSNSPFTHSGYTYQYNNTVEFDQDGYITVSENGNLKALSNVSGSGFNLVSSTYFASLSDIYDRLTGLYSITTGNYRSCYLTGSLNQNTNRETYKEYDAEVSYDISYSENPNFESDPFIYSIKANYSDSKPVHMVSYFPINYDNVLSQGANQVTRGTFSNNIQIVAKEGVSISDLVTRALTKIQKPTGTDIYATDYTYSFSPFTKNFNLRLDYVYSKYRTKDNFIASWP